MKKLQSALLLLSLVILLSTSVTAHLIGGSGIGSGITHPLLGLDHLFAMVAVGIISIQRGLKPFWILPTFFVLFMVF